MSAEPTLPAPLFEGRPGARADLKPGTLYAVTGDDGWIYYGQLTPEKKVGFFRRRDRAVADAAPVLVAPTLSVVTVMHPSITRALRSGRWSKLGRFPLSPDLVAPRPSVQWPVGTLTVSVWVGLENRYDTKASDPAIQSSERAAAWDAEYHVPARLTADYGEEEAMWHIGGPIWRERRVTEERARRWPDRSEHRLPADWVPIA